MYFSSYFSACYLIVLCFQQVLLLPWDLAWKEWNISHLCLIWNYHRYLILYSTACYSKYCICISWNRPVSERYRVPRRSIPVWNLPMWAFWTGLPSDCYFLCFQFSKPLHSKSQLESVNLFYLLGRGLLAWSTESQDAQKNKNFLTCSGHRSTISTHEESSSSD